MPYRPAFPKLRDLEKDCLAPFVKIDLLLCVCLTEALKFRAWHVHIYFPEDFMLCPTFGYFSFNISSCQIEKVFLPMAIFDAVSYT